jgi:F0F1-type ATP synthase alpha subunit
MSVKSTGRVITINHPLVHISGLSDIQPGTVIQAENGTLGQVTAFTPDYAEVMVFSAQPLTVGDTVTVIHDELTIPISAQWLGQVITPLGQSLLGNKLPEANHHQLLDATPLSLPDRARVTEQLITAS